MSGEGLPDTTSECWASGPAIGLATWATTSAVITARIPQLADRLADSAKRSSLRLIRGLPTCGRSCRRSLDYLSRHRDVAVAPRQIAARALPCRTYSGPLSTPPRAQDLRVDPVEWIVAKPRVCARRGREAHPAHGSRANPIPGSVGPQGAEGFRRHPAGIHGRSRLPNRGRMRSRQPGPSERSCRNRPR